MADWFSIYYLHQQNKQMKTPKKSLSYFFFSLVIAGLGTWLNFSLLEVQGLFPFYTESANNTVNHLSYFSPSVQYWENQVLSWADIWGLDPFLIATVMQIESCGDPLVISPAGAQGLFQVMPFHFLPDETGTDPETNARRGLNYLTESFQKADGNIELTLAGYNGGHSQIQLDPILWPEETKRYVHWGTQIYADAHHPKGSKAALNAWLQAGGWHLCEQAQTNLGIR